MRGLFSKLAFLLVIFLAIGLFFGLRSYNDSAHDKRPIIGNAKKLKSTYENWKARATKNGAENMMTLGLGYDRALSFNVTGARGKATLDLINGAFSIEVSGLDEKGNYDVWLIDNIEGPRKSVKPEKGDVTVKMGTLKNENGSLKLYNQIDPKKFNNFKLDLVAVTPAGEEPSESGLLFGTPSLFQRLYYSELRGEFANLNNRSVNPTDKSILKTPFSLLVPKPAIAAGGGMEELVAEGEDLFFNETFGGNGRTCGTCHPFENNLAIDPEFIATLPGTDPLFVAEFNPDLAENFEKPELMRQFGLILENVDGTDDLENKFVMRGVPHTLALATSLAKATNLPGNEDQPAEMTGWSGDGAPSPGFLRNFATGAVNQHFPKTLNRVAPADFILPTDAELDAMEAFQESLGRQEDPDLNTLQLKDASAKNGLIIFRDGNGNADFTGKCSACHNNAGANNAANKNQNFNTNVEDIDPLPAEDFTGEQLPRDGGFGTVNRSPVGCASAPSPNCGFGNGGFNTTPVIESADTGPFFHNNAKNTIEEAVDFFNGPEFNNATRIAAKTGIKLTEEETDDVANFLRVLNSLENIRSSVEFLKKAFALVGIDQDDANKAINASTFDINDAIEVLVDKGLHPNAVSHLMEAVALAEEAMDVNNSNAKKSKIRQSVKKAVQAQNDMCTFALDSVLCEATQL